MGKKGRLCNIHIYNYEHQGTEKQGQTFRVDTEIQTKWT